MCSSPPEGNSSSRAGDTAVWLWRYPPRVLAVLATTQGGHDHFVGKEIKTRGARQLLLSTQLAWALL